MIRLLFVLPKSALTKPKQKPNIRQTQPVYPNLRGMIASNVQLVQKKTADLPLWLKCAALKTGYECCGGKNSCITVSNLGKADFPEKAAQEIIRLDFMLTPPPHSLTLQLRHRIGG